MPPLDRKAVGTRRLPDPGPPPSSPPVPVVPLLPHHRSEAIAALTTKARTLHAEIAANLAKIDALQFRNAAVRRELAEIDVKVREHAWDGAPLPTL